jgi:hypothetical protein
MSKLSNYCKICLGILIGLCPFVSNTATTECYSKTILFNMRSLSLLDILKDSWVYAWEVPMTIRDNTSPLQNKIILSDSGLLFRVFSTDQDFSKASLNPRTELRSLNSLQVNQRYLFDMEILPVSHPFSTYEFFQIMAYVPDAKPLLQLEFRNGRVGVRYRLKNKELAIVPFKEIQPQAYKFRVELKFPEVKVSMNGEEAWHCKLPEQFIKNFWYQWGLYLNKGTRIDQSVLFKKFNIYSLSQ